MHIKSLYRGVFSRRRRGHPVRQHIRAPTQMAVIMLKVVMVLAVCQISHTFGVVQIIQIDGQIGLVGAPRVVSTVVERLRDIAAAAIQQVSVRTRFEESRLLRRLGFGFLGCRLWLGLGGRVLSLLGLLTHRRQWVLLFFGAVGFLLFCIIQAFIQNTFDLFDVTLGRITTCYGKLNMFSYKTI